jgi:hypothetical protein
VNNEFRGAEFVCWNAVQLEGIEGTQNGPASKLLLQKSVYPAAGAHIDWDFEDSHSASFTSRDLRMDTCKISATALLQWGPRAR